MVNTTRKLSFDNNSARSQLDKMIRDTERLENTDDRTEKSDHTVNAAMTGWHLHEWVWAEVKDIERSEPPVSDRLDPDAQQQIYLQIDAQKRELAGLKVEIANDLQTKPNKVGAPDFGRYMAKNHRSINICRAIATGSKHLGMDSTGIKFETFVKADVPEEGSTTATIVLSNKGVPKIRVDDDVYSSSDILREAEKVWTGFIYGHRIDR